ncbi:hypothetical protein F5148DRAFT_1275972 [Russula earlei]|uniref:Uncharacterized protein n=1 Tax=Russula earlei TaxID=71964 RepID=A0ACC0U9Q8_9AGAM|nr:hypothetical protein F5148DRAFT_1275972 [Russula earlei]
MYPPTFPFTEAELNKAGLLGEGGSETMKEHPELLKLSLFALECINLQGQQYKGPRLPRLPSSPTSVSEHGPDAFERASYYNGITGDDDHPELPVGRFANLRVKSLRGVFGTQLNKVWDIVGPQICDIIKAQKIQWSSVDPARFFTHGPTGEEEKGRLGPVVIWIGVLPGSTSPDTAHNVSQQILALLRKHQVEGVVVEWREAVEDDSQGALTLWFHENKGDDGNPSDKVYGVRNCHVLRKNTTVDYVHKDGAAKDHVRVCGMRRFQRGLDEITKAVADHVFYADLYAREIVERQANGDQGPESAQKMGRIRRQLDDENEAIADLERFHGEVTKCWSNTKLHRNIGHVEYAPAIKVDQGRTRYTADWAVFLAAEAKVKDGFEGNVVDLRSKYSPPQLRDMLYPPGGGPNTFRYPEQRKLKISGCATKEDLAVPAEFDNEGQRCLLVGKDGNTSDLTVGRYAGLESFTRNAVGVESMELAIYNSDNKSVKVFSAKGDSGFLVWHMKDGKARIVGQLHSGHNKGGSTSDHVTYCTLGWWLLAEIKKKYKNAVFYPDTWPVRGQL